MIHHSSFALSLTTLAFSAGLASATVVVPTSYDMENGYAGDFKYYDESYSGEGKNYFEGFPLTGGLGDLVDGYIETRTWNNLDVEPAGGGGPYVGWETIHPTIVFHFAETISFASMTFWMDDPNGINGVAVPASITVNEVNRLVENPVGSAPFGFYFDLTGVTTNTITAQIFRSDRWVFLSEVTFDAVPPPLADLPGVPPTIPLPGTAMALSAALVSLRLLRRK